MDAVGRLLSWKSVEEGRKLEAGGGLILARRSAEDAENETSQMLVEYPSKAW